MVATAEGLRQAFDVSERKSEPPPPVGDLVEALARAQAKFGEVKKSKTATIPGKEGKAGYEYHYADLADVIAAIRKPLADEGIAWGQDVTDSPNSVTTLLWLRKGDQVLTFGPFSLPVSGGHQQFGSALTYAKRYQLSSALGIASEEDDDAMLAQQVGTGASSNRGERKATQAQLAALHALGSKKGKDHAALRDMAGRAIGVESLKELSSADAHTFMAELEKLPDAPIEVSAVPVEAVTAEATQAGLADAVDQLSDLDHARLAAVERYGTKGKVLKAFREEFKPEGAVSFDKIDEAQLDVLVAIADEGSADDTEG